MIKLNSLLASIFILFSLSASAAVKVPGGGGGGSGGGGSITGSVWFPGPFTVSGTNWYLNAGITNLALNLPVTNNWNSWQIYGSPTVSNSMFAVNRGLGIVTNSTSFSGLMQSIVNRRTDGFDIEILPNPYYSNSYSCDATIYVTNGWGIIRGFGNPVTVIRATAALNGPAFQVGSTTTPVGGIVRFKDLRIEMDNAGANGVGVKIVDCAEPVFRDMEVTGYRKAGIELASTNYMHWGYADHSWLVSKYAGAVGILVSAGPLSSVRQYNHFDMNDCNFGIFGGGEAILVDADFPNFRVLDSTFKYSSGTMNYFIGHLNGPGAVYSGNKFVTAGASALIPISYAVSEFTGVTNLFPSFENNHSDGTAELIYLGQFVTNVALSGNSIGGSGAVVLYEDIASNGRINNLDPRELRLGSVLTNALLMTDAYGMVKTTALSGLTLSGGTLTATGSGTPSGSSGMIQMNNGGVFGGATNLTFDNSGAVLTFANDAANQPSFYIRNSGSGNLYTNLLTAYSQDLNSTVSDPSYGIQVRNAGAAGGIVVRTNRIEPSPSFTNMNIGSPARPFITNYSMQAVVNGSVTANSFVGSGTGVPILKLQTMMAADNALGFSVRTNWTQSTTNFIEVTNASAGQVLTVHSASGGQLVWTNATAAGASTTNFDRTIHTNGFIIGSALTGSGTFSNFFQIQESGPFRRTEWHTARGSATALHDMGDPGVQTGSGVSRSATSSNSVGIAQYTTASSGNVSGWSSTAESYVPGKNLLLHGIEGIYGTTNASRLWFGFYSDSVTTAGGNDYPSTRHVAAIRGTATNQNWWFVTANASTVTETDTGIAMSTYQRLKVTIQESVVGSVTNWYCYINGNRVATNSASQPANAMRWISTLTTLENVAKTNVFEWVKISEDVP